MKDSFRLRGSCRWRQQVSPNVGKYLFVHTAPYPKKFEYSSTQQYETQIYIRDKPLVSNNIPE